LPCFATKTFISLDVTSFSLYLGANLYINDFGGHEH
jgi:hypothetical protein